MKNGLRKCSERDFFKLKVSYQVLLLWMPILAGALALGVGGYFVGALVAGGFGIDPNAPIVRQANSLAFFFSMILIFVALGLIGSVLMYVLSSLFLKLVHRLDWPDFRAVFKGEAYPVAWFG